MTALEKWKNDFKEFISELSMPRDDYKGIMAYIDEVPNEALEQKPCEDCISRQDALNCVTLNEFRYKIVEDMKTLPSVTPKEKTGKWISFGIQGEIDGQIVRAFTCSKCGAISIFRVSNGNIVNGDLCPNCGAKLVEPQESEDCRDCKKWEDCPCGKEGHENGTSIGYSIGECKNYEPCEDCISRQAVLDGLASIAKVKARSDAQKSLMGRIMFFVEQLPSVTPKEKTRKGEWLRMSDLSEQEDDRYKCSRCGNVVHYRDKMNLYTFNSWCGRCGSNNGRRMEVSE